MLHRLESSAASASAASASIDYTPLNTLTGTSSSRAAAEGDDVGEQEEQGDEEAIALRGRITSAQLYSMGPVTADRAYSIVRQRAEDRAASDQAAASKREERARVREDRLASLRADVADMPAPECAAAVIRLTLPKLQGLLLRDAGQHWSERYSKLKAKTELVQAVCEIYGLTPAPAAAPSATT